jgi:hypothetical protein
MIYSDCADGISYILSRDRMIIDWVWNGNRIYLKNSWLRFTNHYNTKNSVLSHGLHCAAW